MIKSELIKSLEELNKEDLYSLMLFALYKLKDTPEYSTLSELVYILDKESLFNFLNFYGGLTITIPTMYDLKKMIYALMLYQQVNIEGNDLQSTLRKINVEEVTIKDLKEAYYKVCEVVSNYDFKRK